MQKAIIVNYNPAKGLRSHSEEQNNSLQELNKLLTDGWIVTATEDMSGHSHSQAALTLVILEK